MDVRKFPAQKERVETGPIQFGDDWPGVFIRGDDALAYATGIQMVIGAMQRESKPSFLDIAHLQDLRETLMACMARGGNE